MVLRRDFPPKGHPVLDGSQCIAIVSAKAGQHRITDGTEQFPIHLWD